MTYLKKLLDTLLLIEKYKLTSALNIQTPNISTNNAAFVIKLPLTLNDTNQINTDPIVQEFLEVVGSDITLRVNKPQGNDIHCHNYKILNEENRIFILDSKERFLDTMESTRLESRVEQSENLGVFLIFHLDDVNVISPKNHTGNPSIYSSIFILIQLFEKFKLTRYLSKDILKYMRANVPTIDARKIRTYGIEKNNYRIKIRITRELRRANFYNSADIFMYDLCLRIEDDKPILEHFFQMYDVEDIDHTKLEIKKHFAAFRNDLDHKSAQIIFLGEVTKKEAKVFNDKRIKEIFDFRQRQFQRFIKLAENTSSLPLENNQDLIAIWQNFIKKYIMIWSAYNLFSSTTLFGGTDIDTRVRYLKLVYDIDAYSFFGIKFPMQYYKAFNEIDFTVNTTDLSIRGIDRIKKTRLEYSKNYIQIAFSSYDNTSYMACVLFNYSDRLIFSDVNGIHLRPKNKSKNIVIVNDSKLGQTAWKNRVKTTTTDLINFRQDTVTIITPKTPFDLVKLKRYLKLRDHVYYLSDLITQFKGKLEGTKITKVKKRERSKFSFYGYNYSAGKLESLSHNADHNTDEKLKEFFENSFVIITRVSKKEIIFDGKTYRFNDVLPRIHALLKIIGPKKRLYFMTEKNTKTLTELDPSIQYLDHYLFDPNNTSAFKKQLQKFYLVNSSTYGITENVFSKLIRLLKNGISNSSHPIDRLFLPYQQQLNFLLVQFLLEAVPPNEKIILLEMLKRFDNNNVQYNIENRLFMTPKDNNFDKRFFESLIDTKTTFNTEAQNAILNLSRKLDYFPARFFELDAGGFGVYSEELNLISEPVQNLSEDELNARIGIADLLYAIEIKWLLTAKLKILKILEMQKDKKE